MIMVVLGGICGVICLLVALGLPVGAAIGAVGGLMAAAVAVVHPPQRLQEAPRERTAAPEPEPAGSPLPPESRPTTAHTAQLPGRPPIPDAEEGNRRGAA